jgi:hypothetical protein
MSSMPHEQQLLLALQTCALIGLTIRLWWTGLFRTYPFFFGYLLVSLLQAVVLPPIPYRSLAYRNAWLATEGLIVCAHVLVVLELCKVLLRDLPGITTVARRYIKWTMAIAIAGSLVLLRVERAPVSVVGYFFTCERSIVSSVVIFVLLTMLFLAYYPIPLNRNVIIYSIGFTVYFLTKATAIFLRNLTPTWYREASTVLIIISTACLIFWLLALSRRGETRAMVAGHQWSSEAEERLLSKLRAINASLVRTVRT